MGRKIVMNFIINIIVMMILFLTGVILFTINSFNREFISGLIFLMTFFVGVNLYGIITRSLTIKMLSYMIGIALLFVAGSVFGNYGVEQKAIGYSTLYDFSLYGIAISILLIFISSFFFILGINSQIHLENEIPPVIKEAPLRALDSSAKKRRNNIIESDDWEEASLEDIESGEYSF